MAKKIAGFDVAKVAAKFEVKQEEIVEIEVLGSEDTCYTLVVWLDRPGWPNESVIERVDYSLKMSLNEIDRLR